MNTDDADHPLSRSAGMLVVGLPGKIIVPTAKEGKIRMSATTDAKLLTHIDDALSHRFPSIYARLQSTTRVVSSPAKHTCFGLIALARARNQTLSPSLSTREGSGPLHKPIATSDDNVKDGLEDFYSPEEVCTVYCSPGALSQSESEIVLHISSKNTRKMASTYVRIHVLPKVYYLSISAPRRGSF